MEIRPRDGKEPRPVDLTSAILRLLGRLDGHAVALSLAVLLMIVSLVISLDATAAAMASGVHR